MLNDPILLNDWHVVAYAPDLKEGKPIPVRLLEEDLVLWRAGAKIHAWRDLCLHRGTRLSLGKVENECLVCRSLLFLLHAKLIHLQHSKTGRGM